MTSTIHEAGLLAGTRIHSLLWQRGISQTVAANAIGVTQTTFSKKIKGRVPLTTDELMKLARLIGVAPSELLPSVEEWEQNSKSHVYHSRQESAKRHLSDKRRLSAFRRSPGRRTHALAMVR